MDLKKINETGLKMPPDKLQAILYIGKIESASDLVGIVAALRQMYGCDGSDLVYMVGKMMQMVGCRRKAVEELAPGIDGLDNLSKFKQLITDDGDDEDFIKMTKRGLLVRLHQKLGQKFDKFKTLICLTKSGLVSRNYDDFFQIFQVLENREIINLGDDQKGLNLIVKVLESDQEMQNCLAYFNNELEKLQTALRQCAGAQSYSPVSMEEEKTEASKLVV